MKYLEKLRMEVMIKQAREDDSQRAVAEETGLSQPAISDFLRGNREKQPTTRLIVKMSDYAEVDPRPYLKEWMENA